MSGGMRRARIPLLLALAAIAGIGASPVSAAAPVRPKAKVAAPVRVPPPAPPRVPVEVIAALQGEAKGKLKAFYASRGFRPLWASTGRIGPEAGAFIGYLATSDLDGLKPGSFKIDALREALAGAQGGDPRSVAHAELQLSAAFARYVGEMRRRPKVKMTYLNARLKPKKPDLQTVLRSASLPPSFQAYIGSMGWMNPRYVEMRGLLAQARVQGARDVALKRIRLNMERARALPGPWTHHIVVDAASGRLWYYQAGKQAGMMKVVVGKPEAPTPMLAGMLRYAILNPYWNIPTDLAQTLVAPKVLAGRSLGAMGMEALSDWTNAARRLDPATIDWNAVAAGKQEVRIRQLPGPVNSMGRVKFMFPNDDGIYLHDTPDRDLFARDNRHFSNGCVRLEDAPALGKWLMGRPLGGSAKTPEQVVSLAVPMPVYLTYFTVTSSPQGVTFLPDVYGRDK